MKSTVVDESLSSTQLQFCSRENQLATINPTAWETYINGNSIFGRGRSRSRDRQHSGNFGGVIEVALGQDQV